MFIGLATKAASNATRNEDPAQKAAGYRLPGRFSSAILGVLLACLALGCAPDREESLSTIRSLQSAGQLRQAITALEELLAAEPDHPEANFRLAQARIQTGQPKRAIVALEKAARDAAFARPAGLLLVSTHFETRDYEAAIAASEKILAEDPSNLIARLTRGRSKLAMKQPEAALADAERILAIDPDHQNATLLKGGALIDLGRRDEAETVWINRHTRLSARSDPDQAARACGQLALFYRTQREQENADATYQKCLTQYPTDVYLQRLASDFYLRRGEPERAIELHRRAVDAAPDDLRLWARLANVLLGSGEEDDAETTLLETVERFDSPESWRLLAEFHRRTGDADAARKALEGAIQRSGESHQASVFALADLFVEEGDVSRARQVGERLNEPAYRHVLEGAIQLRSGESARALEEFDAALAIWPQNPRARFLAGEAALDLGMFSRAETEYRKAIAFGVRATDAALRIAEIEFAKGRFRSALNFAQRQITHRPHTDETPYRIAVRSALALGDLETAQRTADALHTVDPEGAGWLIESAVIRRHAGGAKAASDFVLANVPDLADPKHEPLLRGLAGDLGQLDRSTEALRYIDAAILEESKRATLHELRARVLSHLDRPDDAARAVQRALELDPAHAPALEVQAFLARERGDAQGALDALDRAAQVAPESVHYLHTAASIAREAGDQARAIDYLEAALERKPGFGPAAKDLAWIFANERRDLDRALQLARIAAGQRGTVDALDTLGWVRHQRGEYDQAAATFQSALERNPDRPAVQFRLGISLAALGQTEEARAVLRPLIEGPAFAERDQAAAALARLDEP